MDTLTDNGLFDFIPDLLEHKSCIDTTLETIDFVKIVIESWFKFKSKDKRISKEEVVGQFQAKGFILPIENFQNR